MEVRGERYSFGDVCAALGKGPLYVRSLQRELTLPGRGQNGIYSAGYLCFLEKVVSLRAFSVPIDKIAELFEMEKKALHLLHIDSFAEGNCWYLDACVNSGPSDWCLFLTGVDLGFPIAEGIVQSHLNFRPRERELFHGSEMGEDVRRVLEGCLRLQDDILSRVRKEAPVIRDALGWAEPYLYEQNL